MSRSVGCGLSSPRGLEMDAQDGTLVAKARWTYELGRISRALELAAATPMAMVLLRLSLWRRAHPCRRDRSRARSWRRGQLWYGTSGSDPWSDGCERHSVQRLRYRLHSRIEHGCRDRLGSPVRTARLCLGKTSERRRQGAAWRAASAPPSVATGVCEAVEEQRHDL